MTRELRIVAICIPCWCVGAGLALPAPSPFLPHGLMQGRTPYWFRSAGDELGFDESPGQGSDRKQGRPSDQGCLSPKGGPRPPVHRWLRSQAESLTLLCCFPGVRGCWLCLALFFIFINFFFNLLIFTEEEREKHQPVAYSCIHWLVLAHPCIHWLILDQESNPQPWRIRKML